MVAVLGCALVLEPHLLCYPQVCHCFTLCPTACEEPASIASREESEEGEGTDQEQEDTAVPHSRTTEGSKSAQLIRRLNADKPRVKKATKLNCSKHCMSTIHTECGDSAPM